MEGLKTMYGKEIEDFTHVTDEEISQAVEKAERKKERKGLVTHKDKGNYRRLCAGYSRERDTICVNDWNKVTCLKCLALKK